MAYQVAGRRGDPRQWRTGFGVFRSGGVCSKSILPSVGGLLSFNVRPFKMRAIFPVLIACLAGCTSEAVEYSQRLAEIQATATGHLRPLLSSASWSGDRLRVAAMKDGFPVTESIGKWEIGLVPDEAKNVVQLTGLHFAENRKVLLDLDLDVLTIDGFEFEGRAISGESPMFKDAPFEGVAFERTEGAILGSGSIIFLSDGRTCMDFDKILVDGVRAGEYGELRAK